LRKTILEVLYLLSFPFRCTRNFLSDNIDSLSRRVILHFRMFASFRSNPRFQTGSYAQVKSRKTALDFFLSWKPFSPCVTIDNTCSQQLLFCLKPTCSLGRVSSICIWILVKRTLSNYLYTTDSKEIEL